MTEPNTSQRPEGSDRLLLVVVILGSFQLLGAILAYVHSAYFQRGSFSDAYLFRPVDPTLVAGDYVAEPILGSHFFGDFLFPLSATKELGRGGYFGIGQFFFFLIKDFPPVLGLLLMFVGALTTVWMASRCLSQPLGVPQRAVIVLFLFILTQPVLLSLDRGQIHILLIAMLLLGFSSIGSATSTSGQRAGAVTVGLAASIKIYPAIFLLMLLRKRYRSLFPYGLAGLVLGLAIPLPFVGSGIGSLLLFGGLRTPPNPDPSDTLYLSDTYFRDSSAFNHSFRAFFDLLGQQLTIWSSLFDRLANNYAIVVVVLLALSTLLVLSEKTSDMEALAILAILASRLIPISAGYNLAIFLVPVFWLLTRPTPGTRLKDAHALIFCAASLMVIQIPWDWGYFNPTKYTLGALIGPLISMGFLTGILIKFSVISVSTRPTALRQERRSSIKSLLGSRLSRLARHYLDKQ